MEQRNAHRGEIVPLSYRNFPLPFFIFANEIGVFSHSAVPDPRGEGGTRQMSRIALD